MGIDFSGSMIVGKLGSDLIFNKDDIDDFNDQDFLEENGLDYLSPYYDADLEDCIVGFCVANTIIINGCFDSEWVKDVQLKAAKFKNIFGDDPELIGMQHIW